MKRVLIVLLLLCIPFISFSAEAESMSSNDWMEIDQLVNKNIIRYKIPGMSAILIDMKSQNTSFYGKDAYGKNIDSTTKFELGALSESFVATGIFLLEEAGMLSLDDPINKYIPWFTTYYKGEYDQRDYDGEVQLTIAHCLYHTSGLPAYLPTATNREDIGVIEKTFKNAALSISGVVLRHYPGSYRDTSQVDYILLGIVIDAVYNTGYESFMVNNVFSPLGLSNTRVSGSEVNQHPVGYRLEYFKPKPLTGYPTEVVSTGNSIYTTAADMERWISMLIGNTIIPSELQNAIRKTFNWDVSAEPLYSAGWVRSGNTMGYRQDGSGMGFSTSLLLNKEESFGICILANMNSNIPSYIINSIINLRNGKSTERYKENSDNKSNYIFTIVAIASGVGIILYLILLIKALTELHNKKRTSNHALTKKHRFTCILTACILLIFILGIYYSNRLLFESRSWKLILALESPSIAQGAVMSLLFAFVFFAYYILVFTRPLENEINYFLLVPMSVLCSISNFMMIYTINESLSKQLKYNNAYFLFFVLFLLLSVISTKLLQGMLIHIMNELMYQKRLKLINAVLLSRYQVIESVGRDKIFTGLNNDCAVLSTIPEFVVSSANSSLTLLFCLGYLFIENFYAFFACFVIIILNIAISTLVGRQSGKYWKINRNVEDIFMKHIYDLTKGFKEILLNIRRKLELSNDVDKHTRLLTETNNLADIKLLHFRMYNMFFYNMIFGIVVFILPLLNREMNMTDLQSTLLIVFYLIGPFSIVVGIMPNINKIKIHYNRIKVLMRDLQATQKTMDEIGEEPIMNSQTPISIKLENIVFAYKNTETEEFFKLGPINIELHTGKISFITGGNGSGKSTLGKLISGLYNPDEGDILINHHHSNEQQRNALFSSVFSDYYLFKNIYGLTVEGQAFQHYRDFMGLPEKLDMDTDGEFSSINLSSGQKKRLALIISYLENKPFMILDEWAAEQDPIFKKKFYMEIVPLLKEMGKGIIIITHDDRYFHLADDIIHMEDGVVVNAFTSQDNQEKQRGL